jgi:hypothetical protein
MKMRLTAVSLAVFAASLALVASAGATLIGVYRNSMETTTQRSQLVKLSGARCTRGGSNHALRIVVGKRTAECSYRTPVVGRDLELGATERLLSGTPKQLQKSTFLAVNLRSGGGMQYQLAVFPLQRKVQLRKKVNGSIKYLAIVKNVAGVKGIDGANAIRLRAFDEGPGECHLLGFIGGKLVAGATDSNSGLLGGRASGVSVGSAKNAAGAIASVDDIVVRVPSPF